ncbi:MAG: ABC transporter ATP-binding protein [Pseudanabaenaceae cyanobacterium bins.68]|nr:ABC transporter ATP-binding protein [Pseudanabaenaceae cyanobacterium bins.68]
MSQPVIQVRDLSKSYQIRAASKKPYHSLRDDLMDGLKNLFKGRSPQTETFWALKDINFDVNQGDVVGIIGRNGAGKSTLLKILSQIVQPTTGEITIRGRVGSLLEVGTGFHPELSGRENIFMNGAILGMKRSEISRKFDEIVAFAEVEQFLDTPVKFYSSGMYVRLAFAVAAHLEPEILIVDEVLAVGDAAFQKKCLGKINDVGREGRTVILVSHQVGNITHLCNKAILLNKGRVVDSGEAEKIIDLYLRSLLVKSQRRGLDSEDSTKEMFVSKVQALNSNQEITSSFSHTDQIDIGIIYTINKWRSNIHAGFFVTDQRGRRVFTTENKVWDIADIYDGTLSATVTIPPNFLVSGEYLFTFYVSIPKLKFIDWQEDVLSISVIDTGSDFLMYEGGDYGCVFCNCNWEIKALS